MRIKSLMLLHPDDMNGGYRSELRVEVAGEEMCAAIYTPYEFSQSHPNAAQESMRRLRKEMMAHIEKRLFQGLM